MAKSKYLERGLEEKNRLIASYEVHIEKLKNRQIELEDEAEQYRNAAERIGATADRLRAKYNSSRTISCIVDKSESAKGTDSGRSDALGELLRFATTLIEERDRIALQYNELRKSCNVR